MARGYNVVDSILEQIEQGVRYLVSEDDAYRLEQDALAGILRDKVEIISPQNGTFATSIEDALTRTEAYQRAQTIIRGIETGDVEVYREHKRIIDRLVEDVARNSREKPDKRVLAEHARRVLLPSRSTVDILSEALKDASLGVKVVIETTRDYAEEMRETLGGPFSRYVTTLNPVMAYA